MRVGTEEDDLRTEREVSETTSQTSNVPRLRLRTGAPRKKKANIQQVSVVYQVKVCARISTKRSTVSYY